MSTDTTDWLLASNGTSVHKPTAMTALSPFPAALCGRSGLSRARTERRRADGKTMNVCRQCQSALAKRA